MTETAERRPDEETLSEAGEPREAAADDAVKVSVVMTSFNAADEIGQQLEALARQECPYPWELVISDGGSTDGTLEVIESYRDRFPHLRVVDASQKRGIGYGLNVAAAAARGDSLLFCEADDEVSDGWLRAMAEALEKHQFVASPAEVTKLNEPWVRESRYETGGLQHAWFPPYLPHASGLGLGIRRELFERIGGYDDAFLAMQDADICFRAQLAGAELVLVRDAPVHYRYRTTWSGIYKQARQIAVGYTLLQRKYKKPGMKVPSTWKWPLKNWLPVFRLVPRLHTRGGRAAFVWTLGWQAGRYAGSIKHRVLAV